MNKNIYKIENVHKAFQQRFPPERLYMVHLSYGILPIIDYKSYEILIGKNSRIIPEEYDEKGNGHPPQTLMQSYGTAGNFIRSALQITKKLKDKWTLYVELYCGDKEVTRISGCIYKGIYSNELFLR